MRPTRKTGTGQSTPGPARPSHPSHPPSASVSVRSDVWPARPPPLTPRGFHGGAPQAAGASGPGAAALPTVVPGGRRAPRDRAVTYAGRDPGRAEPRRRPRGGDARLRPGQTRGRGAGEPPGLSRPRAGEGQRRRPAPTARSPRRPHPRPQGPHRPRRRRPPGSTRRRRFRFRPLDRKGGAWRRLCPRAAPTARDPRGDRRREVRAARPRRPLAGRVLSTLRPRCRPHVPPPPARPPRLPLLLCGSRPPARQCRRGAVPRRTPQSATGHA